MIKKEAMAFVALLKDCGKKKDLYNGTCLHDKILKSGLLKNSPYLGSGLIGMYARCGMLGNAHQVLEELLVRDVVSWSSLISGYTQQNQGEKALKCFQQMQNEGLSPNEVTFVCFLNACSHSGLLEEAEMLFGRMTESYGITPSLEHHTCMVVAFGCAGQFDKAIALMEKMHSLDYPVWCALLGACEKWGNVNLGRLAFEKAIKLGNANAAGAYTCMANIYAAAGLEEHAKNIEAMRLNISSY